MPYFSKQFHKMDLKLAKMVCIWLWRFRSAFLITMSEVDYEAQALLQNVPPPASIMNRSLTALHECLIVMYSTINIYVV
jgi:hypothetical protein